MSADQMPENISMIGCFAGETVNAAVCPVGRIIPDHVKKNLDVCLHRTGKE